MGRPDMPLPSHALPLPADSFTSRRGFRGWLERVFGGKRRRQFQHDNKERQQALNWLNGGGQRENQ